MRAIRKRTLGRKPDGTLPLINIVLLLVLAFMMAGTLATSLPPSFDPLRSDTGAPVDGSTKPVTLIIDGSGGLSLEKRTISASEMALIFSELASSGRDIELRVDARAPANSVIGLLVSAETAGINGVSMATQSRE